MSYRNPATLCCLCCMAIAVAIAILSTATLAVSPPAHAGQKDVIPVQVKAKTIVLTFKRFGGIAGFQDELDLYSDFSYADGLRRGAKLRRCGKLNADQQAMLKKLLAIFGTAEWSRSSGPGVVDGMQESITINGTGKKTTLRPQDPEFAQIAKLASDVLQAGR